MEPILRPLTLASGPLLLLLLVVVVLQTAAIVGLYRRLGLHNRRWRAIARDASAIDLETILDRHARDREELYAVFEGAQGRLGHVERVLASQKGHVGLVRYDAFAEVSGEQSFSLALLDDAGDGAVVSSIVGREGGRVYCKGIIEGRSDRALTDEERSAIAAARNARTSGR